jgi:hypothetical protein
MLGRTVQGKNMNSMARFLILTVMVLVFGTGVAFAQVANMPIRGCPVGGYAPRLLSQKTRKRAFARQLITL